MIHEIPTEVTDADICFLKEKLSKTGDTAGRTRLQQQIALLEDAVTVYKISKGETSLDC